MTYLENELIIISFYRFIKIKNKKTIKDLIDNYLRDKVIRGTILLSDEGINGSLSGKKNNILSTIKFIKQILKIKKISSNSNSIDFLPFNRLKVRIKKEIVSLGKGKISSIHNSKEYINPDVWNKLLKNKKTKIIDVRNQYEVEIGRFISSLNPTTDTFREFPSKIKKLKIKKSDSLAIYCTGGIRCEKASAYLKSQGYKKVYQLKGGILNYLNYFKKNKQNSFWNGECFVFDDRVTINSDLTKGKYSQCYGCRRPISKKDLKSKYYEKGVQCPHCYKFRTTSQKKRSKARQSQIEMSIKQGKSNTFSKISKI